MPLLARAKRIVLTTAIERDEDEENVIARLDGLARQLAWNGVNAEKECIIGDGAATHELLFSAAQACAADLIVLGAYRHSPLHEVLFSGCTQFFVNDCDRLVLLMH